MTWRALKAKSELAEELEATRDDHALLTDRIARLEQDMTTLKGKLTEAKIKLKEMLRKGEARLSPVRKESNISVNERKLRHAMHRFDRLQNQVERLEARVRSYEVGGTTPSAWEYDLRKDDPLIEAELNELKNRISGKAQVTPNPRKADNQPAGKAAAEEA